MTVHRIGLPPVLPNGAKVPLVPATRVGNLIFCSGALGVDASFKLVDGGVGALAFGVEIGAFIHDRDVRRVADHADHFRMIRISDHHHVVAFLVELPNERADAESADHPGDELAARRRTRAVGA